MRQPPVALSAARRGRRRWFVPGLLVAALLVTGSASGKRDLADDGSPTGVRVALIGDSLSTGAKTPGDTWTDQALRLLAATEHKVQIVNAAENGAGYLVQGSDGDTFLDQAYEVVDSETQVVMVFGSDNDQGLPGLTAAATTTLDQIRALAPKATLVVVGPPAPPAQTVGNLIPIRDSLRTAAKSAKAQFVDPLALGWFQGAAAQYVYTDQEHPDTQGEVYLAEQMIKVLLPVIAPATPRVG